MKDEEKLKAYFDKHAQWKEGLSVLRGELKRMGYVEEVKWGMPTYTIDGKNLIGLAGFKHHFGVWFHQGAFLSDSKNLLVNAQEGKTKGMRHIKFSSSQEVDLETIRHYFEETIQNHKEGKEVKNVKRKNNLEMPDIMKASFSQEVMEAFEKFSPSGQNEFKEYIITAKREATKMSRLEKIIPMILRGEGLNDRYKK